MKFFKKIITRNFEHFAYFYRYLRYRVFIVVGLSIFVGVLDGFGLSMFLPMLQLANDAETVDPEGLGNLRFIVDFMQAIGLSLNLLSVLLILCMFFLLKGFFTYFSNAYIVITQQFFIRKIRIRMLKALNRLTYKFFITSDVGRIQNTMSGEVDRVARSFTSYFKSFEQGILVVVYMSFAFFVDAKFALLVCLGGGLTSFIYKKIYNSTKGASRVLTRDAHDFQSLIIQHVAHFKYLKATGLQHIFGDKLITKLLELEKSNKRIGILNAIATGAREPLLIFVVAAVILVQTKLLGSDLAPILVSLLFFYRALTALLGMQNAWNYFLANSGSIENMKAFQVELQKGNESEGGKPFEKFAKSIELENISLSYGDTKVLKDISLQINKNETIAFAGESGSGKTTLVNIIAGLLPPDSGTMSIDGTGREQLNINSFQKRIGYITQDPVIFNDTIFNNVTFWAKPNPENINRFHEAIRKAAIDDFIESLPEKEDTLLGNNGINLSGGQKQRISIARELYKEIDILILDEATSALDSETERSIQENIEALKGHYTVLIVAHRLSTIRHADRIVFMRKGKVSESGNFADLIEKVPHFKRMVELQEV